jgi:hypothetical protein
MDLNTADFPKMGKIATFKEMTRPDQETDSP